MDYNSYLFPNISKHALFPRHFNSYSIQSRRIQQGEEWGDKILWGGVRWKVVISTAAVVQLGSTISFKKVDFQGSNDPIPPLKKGVEDQRSLRIFGLEEQYNGLKCLLCKIAFISSNHNIPYAPSMTLVALFSSISSTEQFLTCRKMYVSTTKIKTLQT